MNYENAICIRERQLNGYAVAPLLLIDAIEVIKKGRPEGEAARGDPATGRPKGNKDSKATP